MPAKRVDFKDKVNFVENPTIPEEQKIDASDMNVVKETLNDHAGILDNNSKLIEDQGKTLAKKTSILLDNVVQQNLAMSSTRDTKEFETFVELKDSQGKKISVSVSPKNIFMKSGVTEVTLEQIINGCEFYCGEDDSSYNFGTFAEWVAYKKTLNEEEK